MGPLIGLIGLIGTIALILWRLGLIFRTGQGIVDTAGDLAAAGRRLNWRRKGVERPIEAVDEPMLAATSIIMLILRAGTEINREIREQLREILTHIFECPAGRADELIAEGLFVTQELMDSRRWISRLARLLGPCTAEERRQVVTTVLTLDTPAPLNEEQNALLRHYEAVTGLRGT